MVCCVSCAHRARYSTSPPLRSSKALLQNRTSTKRFIIRNVKPTARGITCNGTTRSQHRQACNTTTQSFADSPQLRCLRPDLRNRKVPPYSSRPLFPVRLTSVKPDAHLLASPGRHEKHLPHRPSRSFKECHRIGRTLTLLPSPLLLRESILHGRPVDDAGPQLLPLRPQKEL